MIEVDENSYIVAYWFASDKNDNAWYTTLLKKNDNWVWESTFRYSKGNDDPFLGKDEKNIYRWKCPCEETTEEEIIDKLNKVFDVIKLKYNSFNDHFLVQGNGQKFIDILKTKDYIYMKRVH